VNCEIKGLEKVLKRLKKMFAHERLPMCKCRLDTGTWQISASDADGNEAEMNVDAVVTKTGKKFCVPPGQEETSFLEIGFNSNLLLDGLDSAKKCEISFIDELSPARIDLDNGFLAIVMPSRI
jgi:DNA polymerase III sliding clamp (beta) subunit (PCNA family)